jgi:hypothetical protein
MEKHISKKFLRGMFALSAGFLLASCDPVHALPTNHAESIVVNQDKSNIDVSDNNLLQIYSLIESGKNEEVVSIILREIAEKKFGTYKDFYEASTDASKQATYISAHSDYFGSEGSEQRFKDFKEDIEARISEAFYNEITSGSYNDQDGKFSEEKLYNAKRYELYDLKTEVVSEKVVAPEAVRNNKYYVTKELTKDNVFKDGYLVGEYFNFESGKRGYIEEKVFPEILKNKLVESYIYDNNPSSLGRAYARKINYIKVSYEEEFASLWKLLKKFSADYIEAAPGKLDFELITSAVKGFTEFDESKMTNSIFADASEDATSAKVKALLEAAHEGESDKVKYIDVPDTADYKYGTAITLVPEGKYYRDTKLGKILESYEDAIQAEKDGRFATATQKAELDKFTGEGKSKEYGLMQKLISLAKEDYTTDGWFLKNGGATELPSAIRDRLFNIKVANILDDNVSSESHTAALPVESTIGVYEEKNYVRNINGNKLMLSSEASTFENEHYNYIHQDVDGKAFYIVEVLEAPSTAKFNEKSETVYKKDGAVDKVRIEQLSRQVAKILGTKDSYIKDAYTDILEDYEFKFFDTSLFEYLNNEYPDLDLDENDD